MLKLPTWLHILLAFLVVISFLVGLGSLDYVDSAIKKDSNVYGRAYYEFYQVNITVLRNASLSITELWTASFYAYQGVFHFGYRIIPVSGFDDITMFRAYELQGDKWIPLRTTIIKKFGKIGLKFYFAPIESGTKTFLLRYLVQNALLSDDKNNILKWIVFPEEHAYIEDAEFNVFVPADISEVWAKKSAYEIVQLVINKGSYQTTIHADVGPLENRETVKLYCAFKKIVEPPFSIRKTMSVSVQFLQLTSILLVMVMGVYVLIGIHNYRRAEPLTMDMVLWDLDPVEFFVLKYRRSPPSAPLGLALIFYYGIQGCLKLAVENKKLNIIEAKEAMFNKPWLIDSYNDYIVKILKRRSELTIRKRVCEEIGTIALSYKDEIIRSLVSRGYLYKSVQYDPELTIVSIVGILAIFSAVTLAILNTSALFLSLGMISFLAYAILMPVVFLGKDRRTPKGRGAIKAVKEELKDEIKEIWTEMSVQEHRDTFRRIIRIINAEIPYLLAFPDVTASFLTILKLAKRKIRRREFYIDVKPIHIHGSPYVHSGTMGYPMQEIDFRSLIDGIVKTLQNVFGSLLYGHSGFAGGSAGISVGGISGGFGGGGSAGFG